jgi:ketosteroid isomerase-like protein
MLDDLFAAIDARDADRFAAFLAPSCSFRFGNLPVVEGRAAVRDFVAGFLGALGGIRHEVIERFEAPGRVAIHGFVTYTRADGSTLRVPFANVFHLEDGLITGYLIFVDNSALFG